MTEKLNLFIEGQFIKSDTKEWIEVLDPATQEYQVTKEELKKVEILYKDVLLQIDFSYSYSGRGDNPFALEDEWLNRPWD